MIVRSITFEAGSIVVQTDSGPPSRHAIADVLRAADIPVLTIDKLTLLTSLSKLFVLLLQTLVEREILDESFYDGYDLQYIVDTLEADLGAEW